MKKRQTAPRRAETKAPRIPDGGAAGRRLDFQAPGGAAAPEEIGMFLCFRVGTERYLLDVANVKEVTRAQHFTPVPHSPSGIAGVIDLRGSFVPIVNMRGRLDLPDAEPDRLSRIVVAGARGRVAGLLVDQLYPALRVPKSEIHPPPPMARDRGNGFLTGLCARGGHVHMLIDLGRLLEPEQDAAKPSMTGGTS
jgi:purine-binding chemotaxis protein CheW